MPHMDDFGNRMKDYEAVETARKFGTGTPVIIRVDGRSFSRFSRPSNGISRPFDPFMTSAMQHAAMALLEDMAARAVFVQSDEISVVLEAGGESTPTFPFDGRVHKLTSVAASVATSAFSLALLQTHPEAVMKSRPVFDARAFSVPSRTEAANAILWRAQDARKNAISSAASAQYSSRALHGKSGPERIAMLAEKGICFDTRFAARDRFGTLYRRVSRRIRLDEETWASIPPKHRPEDRLVLRTVSEPLKFAGEEVFFGDVKNRTEVLFSSADPILSRSGS